MTTFRRDRGPDQRGNSANRRARKAWLLSPESGWGGDGFVVPCWECGKPLCHADIQVDRVVAGEDGGRYVRDNIRPHCQRCSSRQGQRRTVEIVKGRNGIPTDRH